MEIKPASDVLPSDRDLAAIGGLSGDLSLVHILKTMVSGYSKATVLAVYVEPTLNAQHEIKPGKYILKIDSKDESKREKQHSQDAANTPIAQHMAKLLRVGQSVQGRMALLYEVAHHNLDDSTSLSSLLLHDADYALKTFGKPHGQAEYMQLILSNWYADGLAVDSAHPFDLAGIMLGSFLKEGSPSSIEARVTQYNMGLERDYSGFTIPGYPFVLPNPVAYVYRRELWGKTRDISFFRGHAHNDLHLENIMCARPKIAGEGAQKIPVLIDFAAYDDKAGFPLYDIAYLEFSILKHLIGNIAQSERGRWIKVLERIHAHLNFKPSRGGYPYEDVIQRLRRTVFEIAASSHREDQQELEIGCALAMWVSGLNFARKATLSSGERRLAILYSAYALQHLKYLLNIPNDPEHWKHPLGILILDAPDQLGAESETSRAGLTTPLHEPGSDATATISSNNAQLIQPVDGREPSLDAPQTAPLSSLDVMNYDPMRGVDTLEQLLLWHPERQPKDFIDLQALKSQLIMNRSQVYEPAVDPSVLRLEFDQVWYKLIMLADKYQFDLNNLAFGHLPSTSVNRRLIQDKIALLLQRLETVRNKTSLQRQYMGGRSVPRLEEIRQALETELQELLKTCPPAWLKIESRIETQFNNGIIDQDQAVKISFRVINMGSVATEITFDGVATAFLKELQYIDTQETIDPVEMTRTQVLSPGGVETFHIGNSQYPIAFYRAGSIDILPAFRHTYSDPEWDQFIPQKIEIRLSDPPQLEIQRRYHPDRGSLVVMINFHNKSERTAYHVHLIRRSSDESYQPTPFDLPGQKTNADWNYRVGTLNVSQIKFPEKTEFGWYDGEGNIHTYTLENKIQLPEYDFSSNVPLIGREKEREMLDEMVHNLLHPREIGLRPHVVTITGEGGVGKSRLTDWLRDHAREQGFRDIKLEIHRNSPTIKRLLLLLLGLADDTRDEKAIYDALDLRLDTHNRERFDTARKYLTENIALEARAREVLLDTIAELFIAGGKPTLVLLEDTQFLSEGDEEELLKQILITLSTQSEYARLPFLFCVTHTPARNRLRPFTGRIDIHTLLIDLKPLSPDETSDFIDKIVDSPRFSPTLKQLVIQKCGGNPQYLVMYLQWLTADAQLIEYSPAGWVPSEHFVNRPHGDIRDEQSKVIYEAVERGLRSKSRAQSESRMRFLSALAVVERNVPEELCRQLYDKLSTERSEDWQRVMNTFVRLGFMKPIGESEGYQFNHDLIRLSLYRHNLEAEQVRQYILDILLKNKDTYADPNRQKLETAHHLTKLPLSTQKNYVQYLIEAAIEEQKRRNFGSSIDYYEHALNALATGSGRTETRIRLIDLYMDAGADIKGIRGKVQDQISRIEQEINELLDTTPETRDKKRELQGKYFQQRARWHSIMHDWKHARKDIQEAGKYLAPKTNLLRRGVGWLIVELRPAPASMREFYLDMTEILAKAGDTSQNWRDIMRLARRSAKAGIQTGQLPKSVEIETEVRIGQIFRQGGEQFWQEAADIFTRAQKEADQAGDNYLVLQAKLGLMGVRKEIETRSAKLEKRKENLELQISHLNDIANQLTEHGDWNTRSDVFSQLANLYWETEQDDLASHYAERALRYLPVLGYRDSQLDMYYIVMFVSLDKKQHDEQIKYWDQLKGFINGHTVLDYLARDLNRLEDYSELLGDLSEAFAQVRDPHQTEVNETRHRLLQLMPDIEIEEALEIETQYSRNLIANGEITKAIEVMKGLLKQPTSDFYRARVYEIMADFYAETTADRPIEIENWSPRDEEERIGMDIPRHPAEIHYEKAIEILFNSSELWNSSATERVYSKFLNWMIDNPAVLDNFPITYYYLFRLRNTHADLENPHIYWFAESDLEEQLRLIEHYSEMTAECFIQANHPIIAAEVYIHSGNLIVAIDEKFVSRAKKVYYYRQAEKLYRSTGEIFDLIDGLYMLIYGNYVLNDNTRIGNAFAELIELSFNSRNVSEFTRSVPHFVSMQNVAKIEDKQLVKGLCLMRQALRHWEIENQQYLRLSLSEAKTWNQLLGNMIGNQLKRMGQYALKRYEAVQEMWEREAADNDIEGMRSVFLNDMGLIYQRLGDLEKAEEYLEDALNLMKKEDANERATSLHNLGYIKYKLGKTETARNLLLEAKDYTQKTIKQAQEARKRKTGVPLRPEEIILYVRAEGRGQGIQSLLQKIEAGVSPDSDDKIDYAALFRRMAGKYPQFGHIIHHPGICGTCQQPIERGQAHCLNLNCGQVICPNCGATLDEVMDRCPTCNTAYPDEYCDQCGFVVGSEDVTCNHCGALLLPQCPHCSQAYDEGQSFCLGCGGIICPNCGEGLEPTDELCPACGAKHPEYSCDHCGFPVDEAVEICTNCGKAL